MRRNLPNNKIAGWASIFASLAFVGLACYTYWNGRHVMGSVALFLSVWALLIVIGTFVTKSAYLEGHVVRLIRKNQGRMKKAEILSYYERYGSLEFVLDILKERNAVEEQEESILLFEENIKSGFRNRLMMWATRRTKV
jgi:hypothetical protein